MLYTRGAAVCCLFSLLLLVKFIIQPCVFITGDADKILSVMSNIQLPSSHIPDWARNLSEDQWQLQVVNKLVKQRTSPKINSNVNREASGVVNETDLACQATGMTENS